MKTETMTVGIKRTDTFIETVDVTYAHGQKPGPEGIVRAWLGQAVPGIVGMDIAGEDAFRENLAIHSVYMPSHGKDREVPIEYGLPFLTLRQELAEAAAKGDGPGVCRAAIRAVLRYIAARIKRAIRRVFA